MTKTNFLGLSLANPSMIFSTSIFKSKWICNRAKPVRRSSAIDIHTQAFNRREIENDLSDIATLTGSDHKTFNIVYSPGYITSLQDLLTSVIEVERVASQFFQ